MLAGFSFFPSMIQLRLYLQTAQTIILLFLALKPPDLPIEMPDLHVTAVDKPASGLQRFRIRVGLYGFVRRYAIVSVNDVSPIRRHGVLLLQGGQRTGNETWEKAAMREQNGTNARGIDDPTKLLRHKAIIEA